MRRSVSVFGGRGRSRVVNDDLWNIILNDIGREREGIEKNENPYFQNDLTGVVKWL
jgi:hypothetical protein